MARDGPRSAGSVQSISAWAIPANKGLGRHGTRHRFAPPGPPPTLLLSLFPRPQFSSPKFSHALLDIALLPFPSPPPETRLSLLSHTHSLSSPIGNGFAKLTHCLSGDAHCRHSAVAVISEPYDEGFSHSFCYVQPDTTAAAAASSKVYKSEETTTFRTISGASVSANTATSLSTALFDLDCPPTAAAAFESSTSSSVPLQPIPSFSFGPLSGPLAPADRGFLSSPIERGFMFGPLDHRAALFSGPLDLPPLEPLPRPRLLPLLPLRCRLPPPQPHEGHRPHHLVYRPRCPRQGP